MKREQKTAVVEEMTASLGEAEAIFAVDYRGISVPQAAELRARLAESDATFKVVKNRLAKLAADNAGTDGLADLLEGPTALTLVKGDPVTAAKAIATFRREHQILEFKGGLMDGAPLEPEQFDAIARLPALEVLHGQLVGVAASPLTGLARGLGSLLSGLAIGLGQIQEKGLVSGDAPEPEEAPAEEPAAEDPPAEEPAAEQPEPQETSENDENESASEDAEAPAAAAPEAQEPVAEEPAADEASTEDDGGQEAEAEAPAEAGDAG